MKRLTVCVLLALMFCALSLPVGAVNYTGGRIAIITEPESFSSGAVTYYKDGKPASAGDMNWVDDGYEGKALKLSGNGEFLRLDHTATRVTGFTFSAWVNWQGGASGQRLLTVSRNTTNYLTFSPFIYDESVAAEGGFLNGMLLKFHFGGNGGLDVNMYNPTSADVSYALPIGEWHHVAITSDGQKMILYLDGVKWQERQVLNTLAELLANSLDIGTGEWGDPTLNALLDNVVVYNSVLNETRIGELANRQNTTAYLPTEPAATTTTQIPTTTVPETTATSAQKVISETLFGLPKWSVYVIAGIVAAYVIVTILLNVLKPKGGDRS